MSKPTNEICRATIVPTNPFAEDKQIDAQELFQYGLFAPECHHYKGLRPGVTADTINPNWRSEALRLTFASYAVDVSSRARRRDRIRRVAEIVALMHFKLGFTKPQIELNNEDGRLSIYAGRFWYLNDAERDELRQLFLDAVNNPDFPNLPNVLEGLSEGFNMIEVIVYAMSLMQEPSAINHMKKITVDAIVEHDDLFNTEDPRYREALQVLINCDNFSRKKTTLTPERSVEALTLYSERLKRIQAASKDYTAHKRSAEWAKHVALEDKKRPGKPKIPASKIAHLPDKSPREIALEWVAEEMNRRHGDLAATANTIRRLMEAARKADTQTIQHNVIG